MTSLATTKVFIGCLLWPPMASANWLVSLAPTVLKSGGVDGIDGAGGLPPVLGGGLPPSGLALAIFLMLTAAKAPAKQEQSLVLQYPF